jgi:hypothetical protein
LRIPSRPEKRFPRRSLEAVQIDRPPVKNLRIDFREIIADDSHKVYMCKKTGRHRKICSCAAYRAVHLAVWTLQSIKRN